MESKHPAFHLLGERDIAAGRYPITACDGAGRVLLGFGERTIYSNDAGRTWRDVPDFAMKGTYRVLRDGSVLGVLYANAIQDKVRRAQARKPFIAWLRRAASLDALAGGAYEDDFAPMYIPDLDGTDGDAQNYTVGFADHGLVQREDGELLVTLYGRFRQDTVPVPYFPEGAYQYRSWICSSRDGGMRWDYLATLGANEERPLPAIAEGYCEPDLIELPGGALLTVMRTGGNPCHDGSPERYTPMVLRRSEDGGRTWGGYDEVCRWGVWPRLLRMRSGAIVLAAGRPGVFLRASGDDGATWGDVHTVLDRDAAWGKASSGYVCIEEIEPGVLGLFYDDYTGDEGAPHAIRLRTYRVE